MKIGLLLPVGLGLLAGLYLAGWYSFLLFHSLAELFSVVVACVIFVIVWNARRFLASGYFLLLGISYLFVGALDLVHTLAYKGMGVFHDYGTDLASQLWISARYLEAACLLGAVLFIRRKPNEYLTVLALAVVTAGLLLSIFVWPVFPACFVDGPGGGLTAFKKISEYVICGLFAVTALLLWGNREHFDRRVLGLTVAALVVSIFAEISFTEYVSVYGLMNAMGHVLKVVSFYLIYKAIIVTSLAQPYSLLFRELKQAEEAVRQTRDELEHRVRERTADLARTVENLEAEVRDRLAAESLLRKSEARLAEAQRIAHVGNWEWDVTHNQLWWSDETCRIFGLTAGQLGATYEAFLERVHPEDRRAVDQAVQDALHHSKPYGIDHRILLPDGTERIVHDRAMVSLDEASRPVWMMGTVQDITDRKRAEQAVEFERQRLFSVLRMLPGYVSLMGGDYRVRFANDGFRALFGTPDRPCHQLKRGRDTPCESCPVRDILSTDKSADWEWVSPAGLAYHAWGYPFIDVDGTRVVLELGIDVTERKRLSEEVLRISEAERQRIGRDLHDSLGQMLSGVSCLTQVLRRRLADLALSEARDAERIESILAESLQLTRSLSHGLNTVGSEPDSLVIAIRNLAANTEKMFGVSCLFRSDPPVLVADAMTAMHLYRIAQEATHNAVRHGKAKLISISLKRENGEVVLAVRDDGVGLPRDVGEGQGMGLRIMRYRAESIGARIHIAPRPEGGTAVICCMPVCPEESRSHESEKQQPA